MAKKRPKPAAGDRDPAMVKAQRLFEGSGMTLPELAAKMGYTSETARQSVWQFLNKTKDPRLSMLRKFADAVGEPVEKIVRLRKRSG